MAANLLLDAELVALARAFGGDEIPFIVMKGIPLARRLGLRLDARPLHDNDVLVHRSDTTRAHHALTSLGYAPYANRTLAAALRDDFQLAYTRHTSTGAPVTVDLHWAPFWPRLYPVPEALIWAHTQAFSMHGTGVSVFDAPLTIVHLAAHYAQHRFTEPRIVEQLAAAWNAWSDELDHAALEALARACSLQHALAYAFAVIASRSLVTSRPPLIRSRRASALHRHWPQGRDGAVEPNRDYAGAIAAFSLAPAHRVPAHVRVLAFPSIETLAAVKGKPVSKRLYLEYLVRPLRPLARMLTRKRRD